MKAVELAAQQRTKEALEQLERAAAVFEKSREQLYDSAAKAYVDSVEKGKSALVVSPTWSEIESVTQRVRGALKAKGVIGPQEQSVTVLSSLDWTEAEKANVQQYERIPTQANLPRGRARSDGSAQGIGKAAGAVYDNFNS